MTTLSIGAEAVLKKVNAVVVKHRVKKSYRHPQLDTHLRLARTKREAKVLGKLQKYSFVPRLKVHNEKNEKDTLSMSFISGKQVRDVLNKKNCRMLGEEIGRKIKQLHDEGIIHGDLTTSNMIFSDEVYFIDFGLSFFSTKIEDKAVDLHLLKETLHGRHYAVADACFAAITEGYGDKAVLARLAAVEQRGRNKRH